MSDKLLYPQFSCYDGHPEHPVVSNYSMKEIYETIELIREYDTNVLIVGESGTGKSLLARRIYKSSPRSGNAFIEVNCGSLNDQLLESELFGHTKGAFTGAIKNRAGKIEAANGGTLFLDDINSASITMQTKLLHVMENRCIQRVGENKPIDLDIRFICASNRNVFSEVKRKRFREDLYYRINVINLELPPLRARAEEIIPLVNYFIQTFNLRYGKGLKGLHKNDHAMALNYNWPGNVRELKNTIERSFVLSKGNWVRLKLFQGSKMVASTLPETNTIVPLKDAVKNYEKKFIHQILTHLNWDIDNASKLLEIGRSTLFNKIKKYELKRDNR